MLFTKSLHPAAHSQCRSRLDLPNPWRQNSVTHATARTPSKSSLSPPIPEPQPVVLPGLHGRPDRIDEYAWLQDPTRRDLRVLRYLQHENEYCKQQLRDIAPLRRQVEDEVATLAWRQALQLAQQQPSDGVQLRVATCGERYGRYFHRVAPAPEDPDKHVHLRVALVAREAHAAHEKRGSPTTQPTEDQPMHGAVVILNEHSRALAAGVPAGAAPAAGASVSSTGPASKQRAPAAQTASAPTPNPHYLLHSAAPSPTFTAVAFTETAEAEPLGTRKPDRFNLYVQVLPDAHPTEAPAAVGPQAADATSTSSSKTQLQHGQSLLYPATQPVLLASGLSGDVGWSDCGRWLYFTRAAQRELWRIDVGALLQTHDEADGAATAAVSAGADAGTAAGSMAAERVLADPDGQPMRLVRHGVRWWAEVLGNNVLPMEVWALGGGLGTAACDSGNGSGADGGSGGPRLVLPRCPGRSYTLHHVPLERPTAGGCSSDADEGHEGGALLLWLRDVDRPNGCLLLLQPPSQQPAQQLLHGSTDPAVAGLPTVCPHDASRRIVHVMPSPSDAPGRFLVVYVHVDSRGDPLGLYDFNELQLNVQHGHVGLEDACGNHVDAAVEAAARAAPRAGAQVGVDVCVVHSGSLEVSPAQHAVSVLGWKEHEVEEQGREEGGPGPEQGRIEGSSRSVCTLPGGLVAVAVSSLVHPPVTAHVRLLPVGVSTARSSSHGSGQGQGQGADGSSSSRGSPGVGCVRVELGGAGAGAAESRAAGGSRDAGVDAAVERLWAEVPGEEGVQVPITVVLPRDRPAGPCPLLLRVYGAYGSDGPMDYQPAVAALVARGVGYAVAHVRGGGQLGPGWYEAGRGAGLKGRSAVDLLAAVRRLVTAGVAEPGVLCIECESAGGWALGAALNQSLSVCSSGSSSTTGKQAHAAAAAAAGASQPDQQPLCRAVLMTVPSLDPLGALLERRDYELGDPRVSPEVYDGMTAWSPYDGLLGHNMQSTDVGPGRDVYAAVSVRSFAEGGLARQEQQQQQPPPCYPALLLRIGLYDTEVPYWEPARYMARLRRLGMGRRRSLPLLMQVKPGGHQAYDTFADDALRCSFVLWVLGVWRPAPDAGAARRQPPHDRAGPSGKQIGFARQPPRR